MRTRSSYFLLCAALTALGCASSPEGASRAEGRLTDAEGAQTRGFGGEGTTSAASAVQASAVRPDGSLELLAEAEIEADATYSIELPAERRGVVLQAVDASGEVLAAAILDASGAAGETVTVTPMDSESSLEAAIFIEMIAQGTAPEEANSVDLRARVNAEMAAAVRFAHDTGDDVEPIIVALAEGVRAAQETEIAVLAGAGVSASQSALFEAEQSASAELSAALDAGGSADAAYDAFFSALTSASAELGADAAAQGRAEASASASFRATIEARVTGEASAAIREAALLAAASLEARAQAEATAAILAAGEAGAQVQESAVSAAAELRASVSAAATAEAAAEAYAAFGADIHGEAGLNGSILGAYLEAGLVGGASAEAAVAASATAAAQLDAALDLALQTAVTASGAIDASALSANVAAAFEAYFTAIEAQHTALAAASGELEAETTLDLLIVADGSFR